MTRIHLTTAANENYAPGLLVMVASALTSLDPSAAITIHVFNGGLSSNSLKTLERICKTVHPHGSLVNIPFDESFFKGVTVGPGNSFMCYTRLLLGTMIDCEKAIYLDSDILVLRDLKEVWEMDMQGKTSLVCKDDRIPTISFDCPWPLDEKSRNIPYFNSGLMVIDLNQWRRKSIESESLKLARSSECKFYDQTILNYILRDDVAFINNHWNWQAVSEPEKEPKNYHFVERQKPWSSYRGELRCQLWRLYYSTFVGAPELYLLSRKQYRLALTWAKDYLTYQWKAAAFVYRIYLTLVYGKAAAKASCPPATFSRDQEWRQTRLAEKNILGQYARKIRLKAS